MHNMDGTATIIIKNLVNPVYLYFMFTIPSPYFLARGEEVATHIIYMVTNLQWCFFLTVGSTLEISVDLILKF